MQHQAVPLESTSSSPITGPPELLDVYGDGSHTTPTKWWAALGGYGVWVPKWPGNEPCEKNIAGGAIGQAGSSTRQEITAWIMSLTLPIRSMYATDSASMLSKAKRMLTAIGLREHLQADEKKLPQRNPFRRPWGLQRDGDLWRIAWNALAIRGAGNQDLRKVKGHATEEDIEQGKSTVKDRNGNNKSDTLADRGVESINGVGLVKL